MTTVSISTESTTNSLSITKQCGTIQTLQLMHDGLEREVFLYIPSILCDETAVAKMMELNKISFDPLQHQMTLPMMVALQGYTEMGKKRIEIWMSSSEESTFILIAPNGYQSSWNGDQCCGYAADNNLNDTAFIQSVIHKVQQSFSAVFPFITLYGSTADNRNDGYLWITGMSNGGFMSDKLVSFKIYPLIFGSNMLIPIACPVETS